MDQQQVEAWIAANGGPGVLQYTTGKKRIPNPAYGRTLASGEDNPLWEPGAQPFIESDEEVWTNSKTDATLRVTRKPDGSFDVLQNQGANPNKPSPSNDGPPGGKPFIDEDGPNGRRMGWNPSTKAYDRDLGSSPQAQAAAATPPKEEVNPSDPTRLRKPDGKGGWVDAGPNAAGIRQAEADRRAEADRNKPDGKPEKITGSDGKLYTRYVTVNPDGTVITRNFGPDGKQVPEIPGEGPSRPKTAGPPLPEFVLGQSQQALSTYHRQLAEGVAAGRWSQAWADARFNEAERIANVAVTEAATQQRNEESARNAGITVATQKQNAMGTATNNALSFVNSINGLLPKGSPLGGQAFAALMGLQMLQAQMSGINSVNTAAAKPAAAPTLTPAEISNADALSARRTEIMANPVFKPAPPATLPVTPNQREGRGVPPQVAPAAPVVPAAPAPAEQPAQDPRAPASQYQPPLGQGLDLSDYAPQPAPPAAETPTPLPHEMTPPPGVTPTPFAPFAPFLPSVAPPLTPTPQPDMLDQPMTVQHYARGPVVMTRREWDALTPGQQAEYTPPPAVTPQTPVPVVEPTNDGAMSKIMPQQEWSALAQYAPPVPAPVQQQPMAAGEEPVAVKRARIASTPPWRLDPADIAWADQNGFGNEAWAIPGRVA